MWLEGPAPEEEMPAALAEVLVSALNESQLPCLSTSFLSGSPGWSSSSAPCRRLRESGPSTSASCMRRRRACVSTSTARGPSISRSWHSTQTVVRLVAAPGRLSMRAAVRNGTMPPPGRTSRASWAGRAWISIWISPPSSPRRARSSPAPAPLRYRGLSHGRPTGHQGIGGHHVLGDDAPFGRGSSIVRLTGWRTGRFWPCRTRRMHDLRRVPAKTAAWSWWRRRRSRRTGGSSGRSMPGRF